MSLAAIFLGYTFKGLLDVITAAAPRRFTALTTSCSAAHNLCSDSVS